MPKPDDKSEGPVTPKLGEVLAEIARGVNGERDAVQMARIAALASAYAADPAGVRRAIVDEIVALVKGAAIGGMVRYVVDLNREELPEDGRAADVAAISNELRQLGLTVLPYPAQTNSIDVRW